MNRVLVIKLGALGDFVLALAAMRRIREAHPEAAITLLTTAPYAALGDACPYVDVVKTDGRPNDLLATARLVLRLRRAGYDRVYDLQTSSRSSSYFQLLRPNPPEWSGVAPGCSHPHRNPDRDFMHTLERQAEQLRDAGIWPDAPTAPGTAPPPDLEWMPSAGVAEAFGLPAPYVLLVPGGSPHRLDKRWRAECYAQLARVLSEQGLGVGVLGGRAEANLGRVITAAAPHATDLTGRTDFAQIAGLGAGAALAVGNDTGPTHLIAAAGAPTLALFGSASDPALCAPRGRSAAFLRSADLSDLPLDAVLGRAGALAATA
jgi:ADP-heptose:LPS heptosyltransferase